MGNPVFGFVLHDELWIYCYAMEDFNDMGNSDAWPFHYPNHRKPAKPSQDYKRDLILFIIDINDAIESTQ